MTSITWDWAGPRYVQGLAAILAPQNHIQGRCGLNQKKQVVHMYVNAGKLYICCPDVVERIGSYLPPEFPLFHGQWW